MNFIEVVDDDGGIGQDLTTVEHQRRDAAKRIFGSDFVPMVKPGQRPLFEGYALGRESDRNAARVGRAIHSD
jgi:hypothetical protein